MSAEEFRELIDFLTQIGSHPEIYDYGHSNTFRITINGKIAFVYSFDSLDKNIERVKHDTGIDLKVEKVLLELFND